MFSKVFMVYFLATGLFIGSGNCYPQKENIEDYENYLNEVHVDDENAEDKNRNALQSPLQRWPNRTIYYRVSPELTEDESNNVREALQVFNEQTCVRFLDYDEQTFKPARYVEYKRSPDMCGTQVGYNPLVPMGAHDVVLAPYCLARTGVIQHETLHVLGLYHEQSRPDRNQYVKIEYDNIPQKYWSQFSSYPEIYTTTYNVPYDYESIMHYSQYAFAKDPSKPSIRAKNGNDIYDRKMGQINGPSAGDLTKVNIMYNCN